MGVRAKSSALITRLDCVATDSPHRALTLHPEPARAAFLAPAVSSARGGKVNTHRALQKRAAWDTWAQT